MRTDLPPLRGFVGECLIQADGNTRDSRVERNTTGLDSLGACLARQVGSWRLPPPPEGRAPLAMQMPFSR